MITHWRSRPSARLGRAVVGGGLIPWMTSGVMDALAAHGGLDWATRARRTGFWDGVLRIDGRTLWSVHVSLKTRLLQSIRDEARERWARHGRSAIQRCATATLLDPSVFTIGFVRRFATTRRTALVFRDLERLRRLLVSWRHPVQIVFAGPPHPTDEVMREPRFEGRIAYAGGADGYLASRLVTAVDLWLNLPPTLAAPSPGTGLRAGLNGVLQLGIHEGWTLDDEAHRFGWLIPRAHDERDADLADAEQLYYFLEQEITPLFYARDATGTPRGWVEKMKRALREAGLGTMRRI